MDGGSSGRSVNDCSFVAREESLSQLPLGSGNNHEIQMLHDMGPRRPSGVKGVREGLGGQRGLKPAFPAYGSAEARLLPAAPGVLQCRDEGSQHRGPACPLRHCQVTK